MLFTQQVFYVQFFFLLTSFDTLDCFYFKSNLSLLMYIKSVAY